ncbi:outer membrane protein transport protein [Pseudomonas kermanshahensis]|uniref:Outer membrane protein transport protein n=1 Tax=Pseudomonas kermanshahensis TaxID=2745482 RepID=A0ABU8R283_9PSED|nr:MULTISPECIES: outer membrane protein transport protein [Pseudomonas]MBC3484440.1 outer membrane protein transport protein [Pseudomonas sp. SWRI50]MBC3496074.1 outer membrane protein transport protein [Pseudomonas sp. SWRI67]MBV4525324.1 outer membrane protein transport protein [Pseudomonas kermanshahensis]SMF12854.1 long-chain fatty acid transport protein [Pseudomonas sp. LAIL14HWK12:I11]SMR74967.1 long-chain fatty acid transport protein [Pseudomonas sp. LAIL14HWK12:I10]
MKKVMLKTSLGVAVALASSQLLASGFALNEQSISSMGTGFAGRSSSAEDASTVFGNPAGMSRLKREQITVGGAAVIAKSDISGRGSNLGGETDGDMVPVVGVPMGYYVKPIDDHWSVGFGVYVPFGLVTDYGSDDAARYWGKKSHVEVVTFQPTVSYAFNDKVSIGFGPTINRIKGELGSSLINPFSPGRNDGEVKIKGDDTAVGYNIGILVQATDSTRVGLTYHSMVDYKLEGKTRVSTPLIGPFNGNKFDATLKIKTPESVDLSVTHELDDQWTLYAGSTWTRWSRLEDITVQNDVPAPLAGSAFQTITEEQNWHDTWAHAIGASYKVNKEWVLRTGFTVDQSPTNNHDRSPRIPTGDRKVFSLGAGWSPSEDMTIDVAYSYLWEEDTKVNQVSATKGSYQAKYENSAHGVGASLTYRF